MQKISASLLAIVCALALPGRARAETAADIFENYLAGARCTVRQPVNCLEPITLRACVSGCPRRGYAWRDDSGEFDLHMTHDYLKKLRNAALSEPTHRTVATFGLPLSRLLYEQVQMLLRLPSVLYRDSSLRPLPLSAVTNAAHTVVPSSFYMVTWRRGGMAHAMSQTDIGAWLISVASWYAKLGDQARAGYYLSLSEKVYRALSVRQAQGGVRHDLTSYRCYDGQYCYWFHSCLECTSASQTTVLNQHLHAVRDALEAHDALSKWRDGEIRVLRTGEPAVLPPVLSPRFIIELRDLGRGGLLQLAFAAGNAANKSAPPNLRELLWPAQEVGGRQRYHAAYRYVRGAGPALISAEKTCHYHFHSVDLLAKILHFINTNSRFSNDRYFVESYYRLLYGRSRGDTRSCNNRSSIPPSRRVMNGVPLAELYQGSILDLEFHDNCDGEWEESEEEEDNDALLWINPKYEPRALLDTAYGNCIF